MSRDNTIALRERSMRELDEGLLEELLSQPDGLALSLYLTLRGPGSKADRIEFKNMLTRAYEDARQLGLRRPEADELTGLVDQLYNAARSTSSETTLCVFRDHSRADVLRLGRAVEPLSVVGDRFHLTPLLIDRSRRPFYVLCLSRKSVRLLRSEPDEMVSVSVPDMPTSLDDFLALSDREPQLQSHSASRAGGSVVPAYHGSGSVADQRSRDEARFISAVAKAVDRALQPTSAPLILAAVEEEAAEFRNRAAHRFVVDTGIVGNADRLSPAQLREAAGPILIELDTQMGRVELDRFAELQSADRAVSGPLDVYNATTRGLVETIIVARGRRAWASPDGFGAYGPPHDTPVAGDVDLIAHAVRLAAKSGATIVDIVDGDVPDGTAAILRYAPTA